MPLEMLTLPQVPDGIARRAICQAAMAALVATVGCGAGATSVPGPGKASPSGPPPAVVATLDTAGTASPGGARPGGTAPPDATALPAPPRDAVGPEPTPDAIRFLAVGDILLSRKVGAQMADSGDMLLPFRPLAPLFHSVDFCFGNLESPFSSSEWFGRGPAHIFSAPAAHIEGLVAHQFTLVNLANNHALDQGGAGLRFTLELLGKHGIQSVGAGETEEQAWAGAVVSVRGTRIGFLGASYASVNDNGTLRNRNVARTDDLRRLGPAIESLRARSDFVVVTMHAGAEYNPHVVPSQEAFAHAAVDAGANLVIGAHPHVVQKVEQYQGVWVLYSLGNFIFDHEPLPTRQGLAARVTLTRGAATDEVTQVRLGGIELLPVMIEQRSTPRLATGEEAEAILAQAGVTDGQLPTASPAL